MFRTLLTTLFGCASVWLLAGCKKESTPTIDVVQNSCSSPPEPVRFVVLNKAGQNLLASPGNRLTVSFSENGRQQPVACTTGKLQTSTADTTRAGKYGGVGMGCEIGSYSVRQAQPVKQFELFLNGESLGTIYYDLEKLTGGKATGCYRQVAFRFRDQPVSVDTSVMPFVAVLQTEQ